MLSVADVTGALKVKLFVLLEMIQMKIASPIYQET